MDLDVYKLEVQRERLAERILSNAKEWSVIRQELERFVARGGGRIAALSGSPLADPNALSNAHIQLTAGAEWISLAGVVSQLRGTVANLAADTVPAVEEKSDEVSRGLSS